MVIGEAPGADEDESGRPFVGAAGKQLDVYLQAVGKSRSDVYIANATKCRPPANRTPSVQEANACFVHLAEEIEAVQPKVILCLGGSALKTLTNQSSVAANRGKSVMAKPQVRIGEAQIFVTYHPAATMHNRNREEQQRIREAIVQDLTLAFSMVEGRPKPKDHKKLLLPEPYTANEIRRGMRALDSCKVLACDLEWTALKDRGMSWPWTRGAELYTVSLSGRIGDNVYSLAFSWPPPPDAYDEVVAFLESKPLVFHNALADLNWFQNMGIKVKLGGDSLLLAFLMDEEQRLALEQLVPLYTDIAPGWKTGPWDKRPTDRETWLAILDYNADDTFGTLKLIEALHRRLETLSPHERDGIKRIYYKLLLPIVPTMVSMALTGVPMDVEGTERELKASIERMTTVCDEIAEIVGCHRHQAAVLAGSPMQTLKYLKEAYGLEVDSSNKEDLVGLDDDYPIIKKIQQYRWERNKVQGTYLGPWLDLLKEQGDGRLHSVYRLTYARTGRTSAEIEKGGSLQLMPRNQADRAVKTRHLVKARDGHVIIAADYSQIELRVAAWFADERQMKRFFNDGEDLHTMTAAYVKANKSGALPIQQFLPNRSEWAKNVTKDDRQGAKGVNFGFLYGQQAEGFIDYAKMTYKVNFTYDEALQARKSYFELYPDLVTWHRKSVEDAFRKGYTETPFGRFRRNVEDANKAINTPVQATASDMALFAMNKIDVFFRTNEWPCWVVGFVHDSILCEAREDFADRAKELIKYQMENVDLTPLGVSKLPVPLKADVLIGLTWGEAE